MKFIVLFIILNTIGTTYCQSVDCFVTKEFKTTIFPDSYKSEEFPQLDSLKKFTPTRLEILEAEKLLRKQIKRIIKSSFGKSPLFVIKDKKRIYRHLKHFNRQYFGYFNPKGDKILFIHAYYTGTWLDKLIYDMDYDDCLSDYNMVFDGGANIWGIEYNLKTKTFSGFGTNGYA